MIWQSQQNFESYLALPPTNASDIWTKFELIDNFYILLDMPRDRIIG